MRLLGISPRAAGVVDQVHVVEVRAEPHRSPSRAPASGLDPAADLGAAEREEHHRLHAHRLDHVEHGLEVAPRLVAVRRLASVMCSGRSPKISVACRHAACSARCASAGTGSASSSRQPHQQRAAALLQPAGHEVHRRRADEAGDEAGARRVVELVAARRPARCVPPFITTTRSASVIASTWSWVT